MTISLILTIHDRTPDVSKTVADSFRLAGNQPDEVVVVLDRPTPEAKAGVMAAWQGYACGDAMDPSSHVRFVSLDGEPGWKSPVRAWNAGFEAATGDAVYCISSEVVQAAGNVDEARRLLAAGPTVIHGKAECSCGPQGTEVNWGGAAPGNLLCDMAHPRPLGFIWAGPRAQVMAIGGYDQEFMRGFWYDDADFFYRLWQTGLSFTFTDRISGTHLHHARPGLESHDGLAGITRNRAYMMAKHGSLDPLGTAAKIHHWDIPNLVWRHLA
jgi:GT2 family glycosyltransferase